MSNEQIDTLNSSGQSQQPRQQRVRGRVRLTPSDYDKFRAAPTGEIIEVIFDREGASLWGAEMSSSGCETRSSSTGKELTCDVDHVNMLSENIKSSLFLNPEYADVHLVVEGVSFPAHKIILAARSQYFRALLYGGMKESTQSQVELKAATTAAFKSLLKYVYTGRMALGELKEDVILDVLGLCHQWGFEELEASICEYLQAALHVGNVCAILDTALAFGLESLVNTCCVFADANAGTLLDHSSFLLLSPPGVTELISRDSFCAAEEKIFEAVCNWVRHNQDIHRDAGTVLNHVRLPLMNLNVLLETVRPTRLVSSDMILDAISAQNKSRDTELRYRGYLVPEENVAHVKHGATVLKGEMRQAILDGDCQNYDVERGFTRHIIDENGEGQGGIVIKLRQQCILNHIRMLLWDRDLRSYSYYIEVSMDQLDWVRVCDHTRYNCRSWQSVFFPQRVVRYIKIVGTHNTVNRMFHVVAVQAFYTKKEFEIDPKWGLLVPKENVATIELSACVIEGVSRSRNALINGETRGYDWDSGYTCHQLGSGAIVVQLAQPYVLSSMRLLLWDCDDRSYSYYIEVSTNQRHWEMVCNRSRESCKSWQTIKFDPLPVVYIRIVGTNNSANEVFHCVHFECPSQSTDDGDDSQSGDQQTDDCATTTASSNLNKNDNVPSSSSNPRPATATSSSSASAGLSPSPSLAMAMIKSQGNLFNPLPQPQPSPSSSSGSASTAAARRPGPGSGGTIGALMQAQADLLLEIDDSGDPDQDDMDNDDEEGAILPVKLERSGSVEEFFD